jgi:aldehyde:ferredoxin oxidoreductase
MFDDVRLKIYCVPPREVADTWKGKPFMTKWFEDLYSVLNSLGLCFMPAGLHLAWGPTYLSKMLSACIDKDITPQGIMMLGEKIFTLLKVYNVRQGLSRKDDTWSDRFYEEPLPSGPSKGAILSRIEMDQFLEEYYELRGWDKRTGIPTREKLIELGLNDIASELVELNKIR